ncbi:MAG: hypothetical protein R6U98_20240 [Pirellulaceae bacterium]
MPSRGPSPHKPRLPANGATVARRWHQQFGFSRASNATTLPGLIFQAVGFFRVESGPTQAVLPLVGLAAENVIRDRYS